MNLDEIIEEQFRNNRIYGVTKPKIIKEMLQIPNRINIKKFASKVDSYYETFYIKKTWAENKPTKEERHQKFLNIEKVQSERYKEIPLGEEKTRYRNIVTINSSWLKKTQKRFNKILMDILLTKKVRNVKRESIIPYLHSAVKRRSYNTNAEVHVGDKYVIALDLKDFYPSVTRYKLFLFFKDKFNLSPDIAMFYAVLSTTKSDDGSYRLGQGLSQSSTLAYMVNYTLFNFLYNLAKKNNMEMSIYVDDIVFSSSNPIPQKFIDQLFGIIKRNEIQIKRDKTHNYKKESVKKITGVYIKGNKTRVANQKHEEIEVQYKKLQADVSRIANISDYYKLYNLYLKFYGNYQHINMVEKRVNDKYTEFISKYDEYFPKGINKNNKNINYCKGNIKNSKDIEKINKCFQKLRDKHD